MKKSRIMKKISIDNGVSFILPDEAVKIAGIFTIAQMMDDDVREYVHNNCNCVNDVDFVREYLRYAHDDLIIG